MSDARSIEELRQMCSAPADAYSAGEWCAAANELLHILTPEDDRRPFDKNETDSHRLSGFRGYMS